MIVPGAKLSATRITTTATPAEALLTANLAVEVTRAQIVNAGSNVAVVEIYHDEAGGSTWDATTIIHKVSVPVDTTVEAFVTQSPGSGITVKAGGQIGVEATGTSPDVNITLYGITEEITNGGS